MRQRDPQAAEGVHHQPRAVEAHLVEIAEAVGDTAVADSLGRTVLVAPTPRVGRPENRHSTVDHQLDRRTAGDRGLADTRLARRGRPGARRRSAATRRARAGRRIGTTRRPRAGPGGSPGSRSGRPDQVGVVGGGGCRGGSTVGRGLIGRDSCGRCCGGLFRLSSGFGCGGFLGLSLGVPPCVGISLTLEAGGARAGGFELGGCRIPVDLHRRLAGGLVLLCRDRSGDGLFRLGLLRVCGGGCAVRLELAGSRGRISVGLFGASALETVEHGVLLRGEQSQQLGAVEHVLRTVGVQQRRRPGGAGAADVVGDRGAVEPALRVRDDLAGVLERTLCQRHRGSSGVGCGTCVLEVDESLVDVLALDGHGGVEGGELLVRGGDPVDEVADAGDAVADSGLRTGDVGVRRVGGRRRNGRGQGWTGGRRDGEGQQHCNADGPAPGSARSAPSTLQAGSTHLCLPRVPTALVSAARVTPQRRGKARRSPDAADRHRSSRPTRTTRRPRTPLCDTSSPSSAT